MKNIKTMKPQKLTERPEKKIMLLKRVIIIVKII